MSLALKLSHPNVISGIDLAIPEVIQAAVSSEE